MKHLVTGGAGFIGSHVAHELSRESDAETVVLDNLSVGRKENVPSRCRLIVGDINDPSALSEALDGVDVLLHQAAFVSIRGSFTKLDDDLRANCEGTLAVLRAAGEHGVKRVVFASSMAVYGQPAQLPVREDAPALPTSPYGLSKLRGEMYGRILAREFGFSFIALRYFNTYGTGQTPSDYVGVITSFINMALDGRPMTIHGDGEQTRDFVWVGDIARANALAARADVEGVYNIGSGNEISINAIAQMIRRCVGGKVTRVDAPPGEIRRMSADISRAKDALGYEPQGHLEAILPEIADDWRRKRAAPRQEQDA